MWASEVEVLTDGVGAVGMHIGQLTWVMLFFHRVVLTRLALE